MEVRMNDSGTTNGPTLHWFEFLLNRQLLLQHLNKADADPGATALLTQFLSNAEKWAPVEQPALDSGGRGEPMDTDTPVVSTEDPHRLRKRNSLRMLALQTASFLHWNLESISLVSLSVQNSLMKTIQSVAFSDEMEHVAGGRDFLQSLYHRWVIRTGYKAYVKRVRGQPSSVSMGMMQSDVNLTLEADIVKGLDEAGSIEYLRTCGNHDQRPKLTDYVLIQTQSAFTGEEINWKAGEKISRTAFESMVHVDLGVYFLYMNRYADAKAEFKSLANKGHTNFDDFPYVTICSKKIQGYFQATQVVVPPKKKKDDRLLELPTLDHEKTLEIANLLRHTANVDIKDEKDKTMVRLAQLLGVDKSDMKAVNHEIERPLDETARVELFETDDEAEDDPKLITCKYEVELISTSNVKRIHELIRKLCEMNPGKCLSKINASWELPIPVMNATCTISAGPTQDYIFILIAKAREMLKLKQFSVSREMLRAATKELYDLNFPKLIKMMDWEVLLVDITELMSQWSTAGAQSSVEDMVPRCQDCIKGLEQPDLNPRSDILESAFMCLLNLGQFPFVIAFDHKQKHQHKLPLVEFFGLLARACQDLVDRKDSSANYRELWTLILPFFLSPNALPKKGSSSSKSIILSDRNLLIRIINNTRGPKMLSLWISMFARFLNHIMDEVALQIYTENLHIWPNVLDEITMGPMGESSKIARVSLGTKLNRRNIQDYIFILLDNAVNQSGDVSWLKCMGDVHLAAGSARRALKCYIEYLAICTDLFEKHSATQWSDNALFKRMIKCCEILQCFTNALVLCQFLTEVDYSMAFGMAQEKVTNDANDALYDFIWDLTILEFLMNLHTKRTEPLKKAEVAKVMGQLELNGNNSEEIQREAMNLRKSQFMRTLMNQYVTNNFEIARMDD